MADVVVLKTQKRETSGSRAADRLRNQGMIPAVLYGHKKATVSVSLPHDDLVKAIRHGTRVIDLQTDGGVQKALIREVQWDHLGKDVLHVDFARVAADETIKISVPIEIRGTAPGIAQGGLLDQPLHAVQVECLAISVPESLRVNVNELKVGDAIHVKQLTLPPGVKVLDDPEAIIVQVTAPVAEPEAAAAAPTEGAAEPEVIGRKAAEEEEEGE
jgi:large subunit ribosomal protein L25